MRYGYFDCGGHVFALPLNEIVAVVSQMEITPVPGAPEGMEGLSYFRDALYPVVDISRVLYGNAAEGRYLIYQNDGKRCAAIVADSIEEECELPESMHGEEGPGGYRVIQKGGRDVLVLGKSA